MDDARKSRVYNRVISGIVFVYVAGERYKVSIPSREYRVLAEDVYEETLKSLRFDDLMTDSQCQQTLMRLSMWSPADEEALKALEKLLEDQKVRLYKSALDVNAQKAIRRQLTVTKSSINKSLGRKHFLDPVTLRFHAITVKAKFLLAMGLTDSGGNHVYDEKSFWNSDSTIIEQVYNSLENHIITIEEYRYLSRNDPWRTVWSASKDRVFGTVAADWTEEQRNLVSFSRMYDGAYQSPECPPDPVVEDDDMFDGWLIDQRRTRDQEQNKQRIEKTGNWKDSAQEVFITAPTKEDAMNVYDLNDMTSRAKIKEREKIIATHGVVEDKDLPDVQRDLMVQAKDQILQRR